MKKIDDYMPTTPDINQERLDQLKKLMPDIFTNDGKINPIELQKIAGEDLYEKERYEFKWYGKSEAKRNAFTPTIATLNYDEKRSYNPDNSENLIIEGDNLEVMKLLLKSYREKIKCIYIDPPYNTGKDFVYSDKFAKNKAEYLEETGDTEDGIKMDTNPETSGRYHSDWLSMMFPRLLIARQLLKEDGVIFISIDDNEVHNLRKLCDEVFGADNYLITFQLQVRYANKSLNEDNDFQPVMEQVLIYSKSKYEFKPQKPYKPYSLSKFKYTINELSEGTTEVINNKKVTIFKEGEWEIIEEKEGNINFLKETWASGSIVNQGGTAAEFLSKFLIPRKPIDGLSVLYKIENMGEDGLGYRYVSGPNKPDAIRGKFYSGVPLSRKEEIREGKAIKYSPIPNFYDFSADFGNIRHEGGIAFNGGKKPLKLIKKLIKIANTNDNDIILDFFAGSGTTGHAVAELNQEDGGNRKYILVQLPEATDEKSEAYRNGFKKISDITIERVKRATKQIEEKNSGNMFADQENNNLGFKVFKLGKSNFPHADFAPDDNKTEEENLAAFEAYLKAKQSQLSMNISDDLLTEILLKDGFQLNYSIIKDNRFDKNDVLIAEDVVGRKALVCLDSEIETSTINILKDIKDERFICLEGALDTTKKVNLKHYMKDRIKSV